MDTQRNPRAGVVIVFFVGFFLSVLVLPLPICAGGEIVGWGSLKTLDAHLTNVTQIAAGGGHSLVLKSDGSIVGWGRNSDGQATLPAGTDYVAVAAGWFHSLALKSDGSIVGWGADSYGQATPPAGTDYVAIAAGRIHSLALKSDGSIEGWGRNAEGQATPPDGNDFVAIAAGYSNSLAIVRSCDNVIAGDFNIDCKADWEDLEVLCEEWLSYEIQYDVAPDGGDGIVNFADWSSFAGNWQSSYDIFDLAEFVSQWLKTGANYCIADIAPESEGDGIVNMADFAVLADNWLAGL
ncbi:MAG: RCC1 domain-containing protein [Planctomycetota bacterium]|jgi:hypothetical protein